MTTGNQELKPESVAELQLRIVKVPLPASVNGVSTISQDGCYVVAVNSGLAEKEQTDAFIHEMLHIWHQDFETCGSLQHAEADRHQETILISGGNGEINMENTNLKDNISKNLSCIMSDFGCNPSDVSRDLNISRTTITKWMKGLSMPHTFHICMLTNYFKLSVDDIVDDAMGYYEKTRHTRNQRIEKCPRIRVIKGSGTGNIN